MTKLLTLDQLSPRLQAVDTMILELVKRRMDLCCEVEAVKHEQSDDPIVRGEIERVRIEYARKWAAENGLSPDLAATLEYIIISESCHLQMEQRQANKRPVFEPKSEDEWLAHLKQNLILLTERWCTSYDKDYEKRAFATKAYLATEYRLMLSELEKLGDRSLLLDLGCATGRASIPLAIYFDSVIGYDISQHMVNVANLKSDIAGLGEKTQFETLDIESGIPLPDAQVSMAIVTLGTASDMPDIYGVVGEILRVLKPGGRFFLSFYNRDALLYRTNFVPWPVGLAASINLQKDCLDVHSENDILSIFAKAYTVDDVLDILHHFVDVELATYPTIGAILPNDVLDEEQFSIHAAIAEIDEELMSGSRGAYIIATGQKP